MNTGDQGHKKIDQIERRQDVKDTRVKIRKEEKEDGEQLNKCCDLSEDGWGKLQLLVGQIEIDDAGKDDHISCHHDICQPDGKMAQYPQQNIRCEQE
jgi:hypothetical protein